MAAPEPNTEPFASKDVVTTISHANFRVGDVDSTPWSFG